MTKKDYAAIADAIKAERDLQNAYGPGGLRNAAMSAIDDVALALVDVIKRDNPRFNADTFAIAATLPLHKLREREQLNKAVAACAK